MENKEYLNEQRFQQNNAKVKKTGKILLALGITILIISIILLVSGFLGTGNSAMNSFNSSNNTLDMNGVFGNIGLFALGGFMSPIGFLLTIAGGVILFIAHRREITAYTVQQVMPIAQEGIEKMTPTISKAAGEIAKGVKQGLKEADKE